MNLSTHFTVDEFCQSDTACRLCINNDLPADLLPAAKATAEMLEGIRSHLGCAILISSGYRCGQLNAAIGSGPGSDHIRAMAADFRAPAFGTPYEIAKTLAPLVSVLGIGQLIYEHTWVHVSTRIPDKIINRVLTVQGKDYVAGIVKD